MSKQTVTLGVYQYLKPDNSNIANFGTLYTSLPKVANEADLFTNTFPGVAVGGTIYMFFTNQVEKRIAMGGPHSGNKFRIYDTGMLIIFKSPIDVETWDAQNNFDQFIDSLTEFIQANRTPNIPTSDIFQWGEGNETGGIDIQIDYTIPRTINGESLLFQAVLHVNACEILIT